MLRHAARALLGAVFVQSGIDQIRRPQERAEAAGPYVEALSRRTRLPDDPVLLVRVNGAVMVAGGLGLITNTAPRPSAVVLAAGLIPTTVFGHQFWAASDAGSRGRDSVQFLKNAGLLGGLILAALDTEGRPGLGWRARDTGRRAQRATHRAAKAARREASSVRRQARSTRRVVKATVRAERLAATQNAQRAARNTVRKARSAVESAVESLPGAAG